MAPTNEFEAADEFEATPEGFTVTSAQFDATVVVEGDAYRVRNELPTLDAAVAGETVADVVEEGWYETLDRRVEDVDGATRGEADDPTVERDGDRVVVETVVTSETPAADALAVVTYVEGTWFEGIVPGYEYVEAVQAMRDRARQQGSGDATPL